MMVPAAANNQIPAQWKNEILHWGIEKNYLRIAIFSEDKSLLFANESMQKLLSGIPYQKLINPTFDKLCQMPQNGLPLIFEGFLTIGEYSRINPSFPALVFRKNNQLLILASEDLGDLHKQNLTLHELNCKISDLQRQLITEKRNLEDTLSALDDRNRKLQKINCQKDKLFSVIAHDLKSPFHGILGITEILKENRHELNSAQVEHYIEQLYKSTISTHNLLENLLEWASLQREKTRVKPECIRIDCLFDEILILVDGEASNKNIHIKIQITDGLKWVADKNMLLSILRNLVNNAIKFSFRNSEVTIFAGKINTELEIKVADTGIGMAPEVLEKLFINEFNSSLRGTENEKGSGIGLAICREFIEMHGGKIWAESQPGKGTTVTFTLPSAD